MKVARGIMVESGGSNSGDGLLHCERIREDDRAEERSRAWQHPGNGRRRLQGTLWDVDLPRLLKR